MTNTDLNFDDVITLAENAIEFEGLQEHEVFNFMIDCGLTEKEADECIELIEYEAAA